MDNRTRSRRKRQSTEMYPLVEAYIGSDLGREAFCAQHDLPISALNYWQTKYRREHGLDSGRKGNFVPLSVSPPASGDVLMELNLSAGGCLRFYAYPEVKYLQALIEGISC